ncbi:HlyD family efflux transporter periplasmic adaptor subunit [Jannaschia seohaensis]|uniref:GAF domain-containing protein n=1 Tax=Jannaschia seohaensis TaxID=475081 RepID=A0A2Y9AJD3_9RHOB|nr:HlyD family efflux transporter periplasmic adaptor subunit [Jannaschia seohaensis]PWJ20241.1 GAF domain-containing protein [Jannaschia seohaensis]SSA44245.1 GAF domain-containing protein [Jannaschia seohaensis]
MIQTQARLQEVAGPEAELLDTEVWSRLHAAPSAEAFAAAWLDLQCRLLGAVRLAAVLMAPEDGTPMKPIALRPATAQLSPGVISAAERAAAEKRGVVRKSEDGASAFALPILIDDTLRGVVALEFLAGSRVEAKRVMRQLQWGTGWLEVLIRRRHPGSREQLVSIIELVSSASTKLTYADATLSLVNELARRLDCERVSLGRLRGRHARVRAVSNNAAFKQRSKEIRAIAGAMDEAIEQREVIRLPQAGEGTPLSTRAHRDLAERGGRAVLTAPLHLDGEAVGAITLEREAPFRDADAALLEQLAALVTPSLEARRQNDRWFFVRARDQVAAGLRMVLGPRHVAAKLIALGLIATAAFLLTATGTWRVSSDARLEATVRRVITAPMQGFVETALVRPGDIVAEGAPMAELDDSELRLELVRVLAEKSQYEQKYREAFAAEERAEARVVRAQIDGAEARLALIEAQLDRVTIAAPFDGVVVSGDLSQALGSPVNRGDVLFEVAPLDAYRVVAQVDERDISRIEPGQEGAIVLASLPDRSFPFTVETLTPVSEVVEGANRFRVEGRLEQSLPEMRPGMEGVAKIAIEERRLAWVWTHRFLHWARMTAWRWWPHG